MWSKKHKLDYQNICYVFYNSNLTFRKLLIKHLNETF